MVIQDLLQRYVLQCHQGCFKHIKTCLICKGENWRSLKRHKTISNELKQQQQEPDRKFGNQEHSERYNCKSGT